MFFSSVLLFLCYFSVLYSDCCRLVLLQKMQSIWRLLYFVFLPLRSNLELIWCLLGTWPSRVSLRMPLTLPLYSQRILHMFIRILEKFNYTITIIFFNDNFCYFMIFYQQECTFRSLTSWIRALSSMGRSWELKELKRT